MNNDVLIDKLTPCLERVSSGEIIETSYRKSGTISSSQALALQSEGWLFDWSKPQQFGYDIYLLSVAGSERVEGMIAFKVDEVNQAVQIDIVESAPHNRGEGKEYLGVGGHLFAIACECSRQAGYGGFAFFDAKTHLFGHYIKEFQAKFVIGQTMCIDEQAASILLEKYILRGEGHD